MAKPKTAKQRKKQALQEKLIDEMLRLSTSGFGLVAALAWNDLIRKTVEQYIEPVVGKNSSIISLFIYAIVVTVLAVSITYYLTKLKK
ncbi:hypothetical protein KBA63_00765 [Candidatus Woesebacteria bacterium]|jgi:uncharacterized membrane protein (DUF106 family)|nr:hypothetical protein [Candidatus Woesebacteria bacterium]MBP9687762.1 hypothetical protein [Candidatus Woesebacteria bacterium]